MARQRERDKAERSWPRGGRGLTLPRTALPHAIRAMLRRERGWRREGGAAVPSSGRAKAVRGGVHEPAGHVRGHP